MSESPVWKIHTDGGARGNPGPAAYAYVIDRPGDEPIEVAGRLGPTAVLDVADVKVILISHRWQTLDPEMIRFVGIDPLEEKVVVVKSTIHYRAAFEPIAKEIIEVDAPGLSSSNLARFEYRRIRRPIFPLDPDTVYEPE